MAKVKGFLLIDGAKNTIVITPKMEEWNDLIDWLRREHLDQVKQHATRKELDHDISLYLKGQYEQEDL
jgi:hypothetical protein